MVGREKVDGFEIGFCARCQVSRGDRTGRSGLHVAITGDRVERVASRAGFSDGSDGVIQFFREFVQENRNKR